MSILLSNTTSLQEILETVNNLPENTGGEQATPEISINSAGLITATAGTKSSTYQLAFQSAKTITPSTLDQIAVSSRHYTGGDITVKGDSNLIAENIISGKSIFGVSGTAEVGGTGSEVVEYSENEDAIISRTIAGNYMNNRIENVGRYAFNSCSSLESVNFPLCTTIGESAFGGCYELTFTNFPACTTIGSRAFIACENLISVNFPVCTTINNTAFSNCYRLKSANFPACTTIGNSAFAGCSSLISVNFPVCTTINTYAFNNCIRLVSVNFPACTTITGYAFYSCWNLASANFSVCTSIGNTTFYNCRTLSALILGASSICRLASSNAFTSTPYAGYSKYFSGTPYIYVPSSLVTAYQSATNWAYFSSYFSSIESLE